MDNNTPPTPNTPNTQYQYPAPGQPIPAGIGNTRPVVPPSTVYGGVAPARPVKEKHREPYTATRADGFFAIACLLLGILFYRNLWFFMPWQGWGVSLFTACYAAVMLVYAQCKAIPVSKTSWYWLGILLLTGLSYALWPASSLKPTRSFFLFAVALYWCGSLMGIQLEKKTGNFLPFDVVNMALLVPFRNFFVGIYSFKAFAATGVNSEENSRENNENTGEKTEVKNPAGGRQLAFYALIGVALCIPVFLVVLPMLLTADGGVFADLTENITKDLLDWFNRLNLWDIWQYIFGGLAALYICGLGAGAAHKRYTGSFDTKKIQKHGQAARVLPNVSGLVLLGVVSLLYVVFIACQIPYYFSAFGGTLPQGFAQYSEYARQGFFELCRIAVFNMALLALVNCLCRTPTRDALPLRILNLVMVTLNLLLIITAFSKMAMYIDVYGLTPKRLLTSVFMVFMAVDWGAVAVLQYKRFSILRVAALAGSLMFCALCLCNADGLILRYNANRYISGTLADFDMDIITSFESQGETQALLDVYHYTQDAELKERIAKRLERYINNAGYEQGTKHDTLAFALTRNTQLPLELEQDE